MPFDGETINKEKKKMVASSIPVIDMQDFPAESQKLLAACEEYGCFRIVNHGVPPELMLEMKTVAGELFELPMETKQKTAGEVVGKGYIPPTDYSPLYETYGIYDVASDEAVQEFCANLGASPQQRYTITKYYEAVETLTSDIGGKLVNAMGLSNHDIFKGWPCQFRMLKYNFAPDTVGHNGALMHTDLSFLTILQDDENVGGLELVNKYSGEFFEVEPSPVGALLVVIGDIAKVWSNGKFLNVKHRVQCKEGTARISIVTFVLAPRDGKVEAPSELVGPENPRLYGPFDLDEYRMLRLSMKASTGEALEHFLTTPKC